MLIPEAKVQEILERTDIVGLIGSRIELKRSGRNLKALCPFHGERTPSFHVFPDRRRFKCFGCGVGGDAISFVMKQDGKSFVDAAKELAAAAGVRLDDAGDDRLQREKLNQRRVHKLASRFLCRADLRRAGRSVRRAPSFDKLRLPPASLKTFELGYSPATWDAFSSARPRRMLDLALSAGLVNEMWTTSPSGQETPANQAVAPAAKRSTYDFFRGRLMIPIHNAEGATRGLRRPGSSRATTRASSSTRASRPSTRRRSSSTASTRPGRPSARPARHCWSRATSTPSCCTSRASPTPSRWHARPRSLPRKWVSSCGASRPRRSS